MVDTQGWLLAVSVQAGNIQDREGAKEILGYSLGTYPRLSLVWADSAYSGDLVAWTSQTCGWTLEIVKRSDDQKQSHQKGFEVQPHRWIVERTFAWLCKYRRLVRDYEYLTHSSEAMIRLAMCHIMLRRLTT
jgi:putative transposase